MSEEIGVLSVSFPLIEWVEQWKEDFKDMFQDLEKLKYVQAYLHLKQD